VKTLSLLLNELSIKQIVWLMLAGHLAMPMTPEQMQAWTLQRELDERNRPMTDDEIETLLPTGYKVNIEQRLYGYT